MAEKVAGTESEFVALMNKKAKQLGLKNTNFVNPHGLDTEGHYSSARDMSIMALELLKHERILKYTSIYEDYLAKKDGSSIWLVNTNKLVRFYDGVDGLKTGFTENAKYCITTTAKKNNMRLVSVVMGAETSNLRSKDTTNLLNFGFNTYKTDLVFSKSKKLKDIKVINGKNDNAKIKLKKDLLILNKKNKTNEKYNIKFNISKKIIAPKKKNYIVGVVDVVDKNGKIITSENVVLKDDIAKANILDYFIKNIKFTISSIN